MRIAGVDISTKVIAVSVLDPKGPTSFEVKAKGRRAADRFEKLMGGWTGLMETLELDFVFIEDISFSRNRQAELDLAQVLGGMKAVLYGMRRQFRTFNNQTIKAKFNLARSAKADTQALVEKVTGLKGLSEDQSDAFLAAMYGRSLVEEGAS